MDKNKRKNEWRVFINISFSFYLLFTLIDKIANAVSDNLALDLGFNNDGVNFSIMVYSFLFTVFTFPSNFMVKKMGAHKW